jgi:hypothetical protein
MSLKKMKVFKRVRLRILLNYLDFIHIFFFFFFFIYFEKVKFITTIIVPLNRTQFVI